MEDQSELRDRRRCRWLLGLSAGWWVVGATLIGLWPGRRPPPPVVLDAAQQAEVAVQPDAPIVRLVFPERITGVPLPEGGTLEEVLVPYEELPLWPPLPLSQPARP